MNTDLGPGVLRNLVALMALGAGTLALLYAWRPAVDLSTFDWPTLAIVAAAIIQAVTAVVIVLLTRRLASTAEAALRASNAQVSVASETSLHARRDSHVQSVPRLTIERPIKSPGPKVQLPIANDHNADPALDVRVSFAASDHTGMQLENPRHFATVGSIAPGGGAYPEFELHNFRNIPNPRTPGPGSDAIFSNDHILVQVEYRGLLGQEIHLAYLWAANWPDEDAPSAWVWRSYWVKPDIEGASPLSLRFD